MTSLEFGDGRFRWDWRGAPNRQCYARRRAWLGPWRVDFVVDADPRGGKRKHGARWRATIRDAGRVEARPSGRAATARQAWRDARQAVRDAARRQYGGQRGGAPHERDDPHRAPPDARD